jgi:ribosomal protein L29
MNTLTTGISVALVIGAFSQLSAYGDIDTQLSEIKNATQHERQVKIQELQTELMQMRAQERVRVMQKVREQMPDIAQKIQNEAIALKIEAIKNADPMERRELMNDFKKELAQMNKDEQALTIAKMRSEMNQEHDQAMQENKEQKRIHETIQRDQMDEIQKIDQMEKANQRQGADQFRQKSINSGTFPNTPGFGQR